MEMANHKQGGGFVKSMLVISFYKAAKPSPPPHITEIKPKPSASMQKAVSFTRPTGGFPCSDGYVHGPYGVGGDEQVDSRATSYITLAKERLKREELSIINDAE